MGNFNKKTLDKWTANELDRQQKRKETGEPVKPWEYKTCSHCYSSIHPAFRICPYCYEVLK